jgi:hypothetical protein
VDKRLLAEYADRTRVTWLLRDRVSRMRVIQACVTALRARTYLEIGVAAGDCFRAIRVPFKVGVDPADPRGVLASSIAPPAAQFHKVSSDEFFRERAAAVLPGGADVVFIDGLHTFAQSHRDCLNALDHLTPHGVILLHDCLPANEQEAVPADGYDEAARINGPAWNGQWTGDVWKTIVALRQERADLRVNVLRCDKGIGVVRRGVGATATVAGRPLADLSYADVRADPSRLLGLHRPVYLTRVLWELRRARP